MLISQEKRAANRANAGHSTGPNTHDGKAKSSQNATKHGLTGKIVVLPHEDKNEFQRFSIEVIACLAPEGIMECEFTRIVANMQWRLRRVKTIEDGLLAHGSECFQDAEVLARSFMDNTRSLANLSNYEHRLYRNMTHALKQLKDLQAARDKQDEDISTKANYLFNQWQYTSPHLGRTDPAPPVSGDAAVSRVGVPLPRTSEVGFVLPTNEIPPASQPEITSEQDETIKV